MRVHLFVSLFVCLSVCAILPIESEGSKQLIEKVSHATGKPSLASMKPRRL